MARAPETLDRGEHLVGVESYWRALGGVLEMGACGAFLLGGSGDPRGHGCRNPKVSFASKT
jgi:hypothetical protein